MSSTDRTFNCDGCGLDYKPPSYWNPHPPHAERKYCLPCWWASMYSPVPGMSEEDLAAVSKWLVEARALIAVRDAQAHLPLTMNGCAAVMCLFCGEVWIEIAFDDREGSPSGDAIQDLIFTDRAGFRHPCRYCPVPIEPGEVVRRHMSVRDKEPFHWWEHERHHKERQSEGQGEVDFFAGSNEAGSDEGAGSAGSASQPGV